MWQHLPGVRHTYPAATNGHHSLRTKCHPSRQHAGCQACPAPILCPCPRPTHDKQPGVVWIAQALACAELQPHVRSCRTGHGSMLPLRVTKRSCPGRDRLVSCLSRLVCAAVCIGRCQYEAACNQAQINKQKVGMRGPAQAAPPTRDCLLQHVARAAVACGWRARGKEWRGHE
jgi:hypothetical protein